MEMLGSNQKRLHPRPMISVVLPTRNRVNLIHETFASVQDQSIDTWELIVVDDHSNDGTDAVVKLLADGDRRIRYVRSVAGCKGAPAARNFGLRKSRGEFILFLDDDDLLAPDCLRQRLGVMESCPSADIAIGVHKTFDVSPHLEEALTPKRMSDDLMVDFLSFADPWATGGVLWRKSSLERLGPNPWRESLTFYQDWELSIRALAHGFHPVPTGFVDWFLRRDANPRISSCHRRSPEDTLALIDAVAENLESSNYEEWLPSVAFNLSRRLAYAGRLEDALKCWGECLGRSYITRTLYLAGMPMMAMARFQRLQRPVQTITGKFSPRLLKGIPLMTLA